MAKTTYGKQDHKWTTSHCEWAVFKKIHKYTKFAMLCCKAQGRRCRCLWVGRRHGDWRSRENVSGSSDRAFPWKCDIHTGVRGKRSPGTTWSYGTSVFSATPLCSGCWGEKIWWRDNGDCESQTQGTKTQQIGTDSKHQSISKAISCCLLHKLGLLL